MDDSLTRHYLSVIEQFPDKDVRFLSSMVCMCATMYRIDLPHLCWSLENLAAGKVVNQVKVDDDTRRDAITALERMLSVGGVG